MSQIAYQERSTISQLISDEVIVDCKYASPAIVRSGKRCTEFLAVVVGPLLVELSEIGLIADSAPVRVAFGQSPSLGPMIAAIVGM